MSKKKYKFDLGIIGTSMWISLILAILKVAKIIDISIWWVLSPIFLSVGITLLIMCLIFTLIINNFTVDADDEEGEEQEE